MSAEPYTAAEIASIRETGAIGKRDRWLSTIDALRAERDDLQATLSDAVAERDALRGQLDAALGVVEAAREVAAQHPGTLQPALAALDAIAKGSDQ